MIDVVHSTREYRRQNFKIAKYVLWNIHTHNDCSFHKLGYLLTIIFILLGLPIRLFILSKYNIKHQLHVFAYRVITPVTMDIRKLNFKFRIFAVRPIQQDSRCIILPSTMATQREKALVNSECIQKVQN